MDQNLQHILASVIGRPLTDLQGTFFALESESNASTSKPVQLQFGFEGATFRVSGSADGWAICVDMDELEPVDMGDAGRVEVQPALPAHLRGKELERCTVLSSPPSPRPIGLRLHFGGNLAPLNVLNWGDDLWLEETLPEDFAPHEIVEELIAD